MVEIDISGSSDFGGTISGTGTGIVLDEDGHILTNNHVIDDADEITVLFDDGGTATATIVGTDNQNDLAVIKIDPSEHDLSPATLGDSSDLRVGDTVLALGNPFNLEGSLTQGIVSGLDRAYSEGNSTRPIRGMIQTDAAINPGNSGGPLLDCHGEVVGVNTLLENPTGDTVNVGVGFAVAVNTVKAELDRPEVGGEIVQHAWLGIAGLDVTSALNDQFDLTVDQGVYVTYVNPGQPRRRRRPHRRFRDPVRGQQRLGAGRGRRRHRLRRRRGHDQHRPAGHLPRPQQDRPATPWSWASSATARNRRSQQRSRRGPARSLTADH